MDIYVSPVKFVFTSSLSQVAATRVLSKVVAGALEAIRKQLTKSVTCSETARISITDTDFPSPGIMYRCLRVDEG